METFTGTDLQGAKICAQDTAQQICELTKFSFAALAPHRVLLEEAALMLNAIVWELQHERA